MKVTHIEYSTGGIYSVTIRPNWFEKIFGFRAKIVKIKSTWNTYTYGGGGVYVNKKGEKLGNDHYIGVAIDNWKRRF